MRIMEVEELMETRTRKDGASETFRRLSADAAEFEPLRRRSQLSAEVHG